MNTPVIMKINDLCAYLRIAPSTVYRLLKHNDLPAFRVGSDWRFHRDMFGYRAAATSMRVSVQSPGPDYDQPADSQMILILAMEDGLATD